MDSDEEEYYDWEEEHDAALDLSDGSEENYKILEEEDIKGLQELDISTVSDFLSVPRGVACSFLCRHFWSLDSISDYWFSAVNVDRDPLPVSTLPPHQESICKICHENTCKENMVSAACGHRYCKYCYKKYIAAAIRDGTACLTLRCPEFGCKVSVTLDLVEKLASEADISRYHRFLRNSYVELNRRRKWCPSVGCDRAVEFDGSESESYDVKCSCRYRFCGRCGKECHRPVGCETVANWEKKFKSEEENLTRMWLKEYSKLCPKCRRPVQRNGGCQHMTCGSPCRHDFCWFCLAPWYPDGGVDGDQHYALCSVDVDEEDEGEISRQVDVINRAHYYHMWHTIERAGMMRLLKWVMETYEGTTFVVDAWDQVVDCSRLLKWSYVYGFNLPVGGNKFELFDFLQYQAMTRLWKLREYLLSEYGNMDFSRFRLQFCRAVKITRNHFNNFVTALEDDLAEVDGEN